MGLIKLKRGNNINLNGLTLQAGEPAFVLDTGKLYVGNGTNKVLINPDILESETAKKLTTSRLISVTGDANGSTKFDGSENATITLTLANTGVTAGTYSKVTIDAKGRITQARNLTATDIGLGNVTNESKTTMFTSPIFTGTPTAPTPATSDNSTKLATTAYVKSQGFLNSSSDIDGGTF